MSQKAKQEENLSVIAQGLNPKRKRGQTIMPSEAREETKQISAFITKSVYRKIRMHLAANEDITWSIIIGNLLNKYIDENGL